jgi:hypothetical protein
MDTDFHGNAIFKTELFSTISGLKNFSDILQKQAAQPISVV